MSAIESPKTAVAEPVPTNINNNASNINNNAKTKKKRKSVKRATGGSPKSKTHDMVMSAIAANKDRKGSSLSAIKKHVSAHNKVDAKRINSLIKMALKKGVAAGHIKQTSGTGASGRFRLGTKPKAPKAKKAKSATPKKAKKAKKAKKPKAKKAKKPKAKKAKKPKAKKAKKPAKKAAKKAAKKPAKKAAKKPAKKSAKKAGKK